MTDIIPGMTFGAWTLIGAEGRRAWARCQCGTVRQMALEALQDGSSLSCGCINTPSTRSGPRAMSPSLTRSRAPRPVAAKGVTKAAGGSNDRCL